MGHGFSNMAIINSRASIPTHIPTQSVETALKKIEGFKSISCRKTIDKPQPKKQQMKMPLPLAADRQ